MDLKCEEFTCYRVNYNDWDRFVQEAYNCPAYEVVAWEEWGNDQSHEFTAKAAKLDKYAQDKIDKMRLFNIGYLFTDLCNKGLIKEGNYLIEVSWQKLV